MASIGHHPASPMGLTSPLFPSQRLHRPMTSVSQNPLRERAKTPPTSAPRAPGLSTSPSWSRVGAPPRSASLWPSVHDHGAAAVGSPFCSPRDDMDVHFGLPPAWPPAARASHLPRRAQICHAYGGTLPDPYGPSASEVISARKLVRVMISDSAKPTPRPIKRLIRTLGPSASLERLQRPLDIVGSLRWSDALGQNPKLLLSLQRLQRTIADEKRAARAGKPDAAATTAAPRLTSPAASIPTLASSRSTGSLTATGSSSGSASRLSSRPPSRQREYHPADDARWWDDSMVNTTVRLLPKKKY